MAFASDFSAVPRLPETKRGSANLLRTDSGKSLQEINGFHALSKKLKNFCIFFGFLASNLRLGQIDFELGYNNELLFYHNGTSRF